jgi:GGDEF domain-containing protein
MPPGPPRRRRARPVADAPIDPLLLRLEDLAKGWLLALLELAPLDDAPAILAADLARDGPRICAAVVRSLASDEDLRRLEPGGALELLASRTGAIAGAGGMAGTSQAVDALHSVIWSGLRDELPNPDPDQISELAERLGLVIELVRGAALRHAERGGGAPLSAAPPAVEVEVEVVAGPRPAAAEPAPEPEPPPAAAAAPEPPPAAAAAPEPPSAAAAAPEALWIGAVDDEIGRSQQTGTPLSLLLVELDDADRVAAALPGEEATATFGRFAQAVRSALRRHDILACETDSRAWVIARDTSRFGAQALGSRVAGAVRAAQHWRGAPMMASVGVAVLGEDGEDRESLIEAAEEGRYAAAASGIAIVRSTPSDRIDEAGGPPDLGPDVAG